MLLEGSTLKPEDYTMTAVILLVHGTFQKTAEKCR